MRVKRALWWSTVVAVGTALVVLIAWKPLQAISINSTTDALRHFSSAPNCDAARAVGVAPARRGQPGYWPSHDADNDGIACEPYKRR
ncbi:excalibur calcium-binding domain-containing protein [Aminobacter carboxidus]|uniref:excalibur calcium-binding domain-containing protein n=1 Tax=Aminobacter carboxidus TaxID=376165 RepID=UPI0028B240A0|nr:excalibur calcium-binding domain-containing protein [Aminobacter lissarensis]